MTVPFPDLDPYQTLGVAKDANPLEIKKSFKKLSLKYHPDKLQQSKLDVEKDTFTKIQFSYSILSDAIKRQRYDNTGSLEVGEDNSDFDWKEYFASLNEKITVEMIDEDKLKYQKSEEEEQDIISSFVYYEGDFIKLFEVIPHLDFTESEESRVFEIIERRVVGMLEIDPSTIKTWDKYKKSRKTKIKSMLKKLAKEAKEAEKLEKEMKLSKNGDLKSIIKKRQSNRMDDLINSIQLKYETKGTKRNAPVDDIDDDEFEKIQASLLKKSKKRV